MEDVMSDDKQTMVETLLNDAKEARRERASEKDELRREYLRGKADALEAMALMVGEELAPLARCGYGRMERVSAAHLTILDVLHRAHGGIREDHDQAAVDIIRALGIGELPAKPHASRMSAEERALVDAARKRADDAENGPWWVVLVPHGADEFDQDAVVMSKHVAITDKHDHGEMRPADAKFTAGARSDVPALCDLADRQDARIAQLEQERDDALALVDESERSWKRICARLTADLDAAKARAAEAERLVDAFDGAATAPLYARIAELEAKLAARGGIPPVAAPATCSCPAASEYDKPCELHGVRGIGSTGR